MNRLWINIRQYFCEHKWDVKRSLTGVPDEYWVETFKCKKCGKIKYFY